MDFIGVCGSDKLGDFVFAKKQSLNYFRSLICDWVCDFAILSDMNDWIINFCSIKKWKWIYDCILFELVVPSTKSLSIEGNFAHLIAHAVAYTLEGSNGCALGSEYLIVGTLLEARK